MLIFTRLISGRGFPQWVELRCDDMDRLHPPWPLPPAVPGQLPVSRVPAQTAAAEHGSLEGVGGLKTNEAYHSKADALLIPEM